MRFFYNEAVRKVVTEEELLLDLCSNYSADEYSACYQKIKRYLDENGEYFSWKECFLSQRYPGPFFRKENLDDHRLKNILLDFSNFICYNKTIKRKEVKLK